MYRLYGVFLLLAYKKFSCFLFSITCCIILVSHAAHAEQSHFQISENQRGVEIQYRWQDYFGTQRSLSFELDKNKVASQHKSNRVYRPEIAQRYVYIQMQKAAQKIHPKEARVRFTPRGNELQIKVTSSSDAIVSKWMNELTTVRETAFDQYLADNYYSRYESPYGQIGVKPDHKRFVTESVTALLPAAQALYEQLDEDSTSRTYVNLILSWVQSIPYNALVDRATSNGAGYLPPAEVILSNKGDCDSKTALMAAILRSLLPNLHMTIVYLPDHALLGANLPHFGDEETITDGGMQYLLLDPTGPRLMKVGEVSDETARFIGGEMYRLEKLPGILE